MSETASHTLSGVPETSLAALYWRAMESQRPDALIKDQKAEALVAQLDYDFDRIRQIPMPELLYVMRTMLTREMDRYARGFLGRFPQAVSNNPSVTLNVQDVARMCIVKWYEASIISSLSKTFLSQCDVLKVPHIDRMGDVVELLFNFQSTAGRQPDRMHWVRDICYMYVSRSAF